MTINDGFGDLQPVEDALGQWEGWFHATALRYRNSTDPVFHDLVQEGRIAFWRQYQKTREVSHGLTAARYRMSNLVNPTRRDQPLSSEQRSTGTSEVKTVAILDAEEGFADVLLGAADALAGVEMAYHRGQIAQAIAALDEANREYVVLRFWGGWTDTEIAALTGLSSSKVLYNRWTRVIRPALVERLAHLAAA